MRDPNRKATSPCRFNEVAEWVARSVCVGGARIPDVAQRRKRKKVPFHLSQSQAESLRDSACDKREWTVSGLAV